MNRSGIDLLIPKSEIPPEDVPTLKLARAKQYLISTPLQTSETDLNASSLGQQLGNNLYEKTWRIGKWQWEIEGYYNYNGPDPAFDELMALRPGKGFWLQHINNHPVTITLGGAKVDPSSGYYEIRLPKNALEVPHTYHMVGNPYWYPIKWSDCMVRIPTTNTAPVGKLAQTPDAMESWHIDLRLDAVDGTAHDTFNRAGIVENGNAELLRAFDLEPPGEYVRLAIFDPDQISPDRYAYDYRRAGDMEYNWKLVLSTTYSAKNAVLTIDNTDQIPECYSFILTNDRTGESVDLDETMRSEVTLSSGTPVTYSLTAILKEVEDTQVSIADSSPHVFGIKSVIPNPFNPSTSISFTLNRAAYAKLAIYNINGQLVETLFNDYFQEGNHSVIWNAADLASGIYIARIDTQNKYDVRKMMLIK